MLGVVVGEGFGSGFSAQDIGHDEADREEGEAYEG